MITLVVEAIPLIIIKKNSVIPFVKLSKYNLD